LPTDQRRGVAEDLARASRRQRSHETCGDRRLREKRLDLAQQKTESPAT
jgi:hypothetical protein